MTAAIRVVIDVVLGGLSAASGCRQGRGRWLLRAVRGSGVSPTATGTNIFVVEGEGFPGQASTQCVPSGGVRS
jgi:hypothetical protein